MNYKQWIEKETDQRAHKYVASGMSTSELLAEIDQLLAEKIELSPFFNYEEISKYDEIIDVYATELMTRDDLSTYNHTIKAH